MAKRKMIQVSPNQDGQDTPLEATVKWPQLESKIHVAQDNEETPQIRSIEAVPFRGGCNTVLEPQQIPMGGYSMIQNMRPTHPGFKQRKGQRVLHSTADSTNNVMSLYQFSKGSRTERHFYAQMSDDDVLEATNAPPTITTGVFGAEVFAGSDSSKPAAWANIGDAMLFANSVNVPQINYGDLTYVSAFVKFDGAAAPATIPAIGIDYTIQVTDGDSTTVAVLDSLNTYAAFECLFVMTPVPVDGIKFTVSKPNGTTSVLSCFYYNGSWTTVSGGSDGTSTGGATLAKTGTFTFTKPTDSVPNYMYGQNGYWYQFRVSVQLDAEVELTAVEFVSTWNSIANVWDGVLVAPSEIQMYDQSADIYLTFPSTLAEIDSATSSDKIYLQYSSPIDGIYVDVGKKPNTTVDTTVNAVYYWTGTAFVTVGTITDGTAGLSNSGWITFPRMAAQPTQFNTNQYYSYWYYFTVDATLSSDVQLDISVKPYFDIAEFGKCTCVSTWKNRAVYGFDRDQYIYIAAMDKPQALNGSDFEIKEPGDGRKNKPIAMARFYNELMVWQEEKGSEGGCLTLFEGKTPLTYGRLLLSTKIGTLNAKSVVVVDGAKTSLKTDEAVTTAAYWISHYGVFMSDGVRVTAISDDIQNYFDPNESECIRTGYEDQMWLSYDSAYNVLRLGLVSGGSATTCNIFPIYDLTDKTWSFDTFEQKLTCMTEVEAASGDIPILQVAGGTGDGFVYQSNYGDNDVSTAIDSYVTMELNAKGYEMLLREFILRLRKNEGGCTVTPFLDGVSQTAITITD